MRDEVQSAADFLTSMLRCNKNNANNSNRNLPQQKLHKFHGALKDLFHVRFREHWFPKTPLRGSAYRCIRINHKMDPILSKAGSECGLNEEMLKKSLPHELTLWIDPNEVSYRIGENGSICILYDGSSKPADDLYEVDSSLDNLSLSDESEDSGIGSPMSMSPPSPGFEARMSTCKSEFRYNINHRFVGENNRNSSYVEYVAS